jgi:hypothetical protein
MFQTSLQAIDRRMAAFDHAPAANGARPAEYTVAWRGPEGAVACGSLLLEGSGLLLRGSALDGTVVRQRVRLEDIRSVEIGRAPTDRVQGARSVVLELRNGRRLAIAPMGAGQVLELAELVAELATAEATASERVAVVLPLRRGKAERARELVAGGPPFDVDQAGLDRHHVFVTEREVIFIFEGVGARGILERIVRSSPVLRAAARWQECAGGAPRVADETYAWRRD